MKNILKKLGFIFLLLIVMAGCYDSIDEFKQKGEISDDIRVSSVIEATDYYWGEGKNFQ